MDTSTSPAAPFRRYLCRACGWVYDEAKGDPDSGLPAGTRFEDIPDDWACPLCSVTKADFELMEPRPPAPQRPSSASHRPAASRWGGSGGKAPASVVIVGGGHAGWSMVGALRALDATLPITLVSACAADVYDKPLLSVAYAQQLAVGDMVRESGTEAAQRWQVKLLAHTQATRIATRPLSLSTTRGTLPFGELILAHGAQVALPPTLPPELCWRINHLDAYRALRAQLSSAASVVIVGAGLIGCELANDLALAGHSITLIDPQPQALARWPDAGLQVQRAWQDAGVPIRFIGGVTVAQVYATDAGKGLVLSDGQQLYADHVIAATGLQTPSRLADSAGLAWNQGIAVDAHTLASSHPHIHALGDCITINGQASRYIEPIHRQAATIAAKLIARRDGAGLEACPVPYEARPPIVRIKTSSCPLTVRESLMS